MPRWKARYGKSSKERSTSITRRECRVNGQPICAHWRPITSKSIWPTHHTWYWHSNKSTVTLDFWFWFWMRIYLQCGTRFFPFPGTRSDGTKQQHYYNEISTSIAIGILLCALQSVGLNSLVNILVLRTRSANICICTYYIHIHVCFFLGFFLARDMCHLCAASTIRCFLLFSNFLSLSVCLSLLSLRQYVLGNYSFELRTSHSPATRPSDERKTVGSHARRICSRRLPCSRSPPKADWKHFGDVLTSAMAEVNSDRVEEQQRDFALQNFIFSFF